MTCVITACQGINISYVGFSDEVVGNLLKEPLQGLIIQSYGSGNAPAKKKDFLQLIEAAVCYSY